MSFSRPKWAGWSVCRTPSIRLALILVIPALISCNIARTPGDSDRSTPAPHEIAAPTPIIPISEGLAECVQGDVAVHFHVRLTITLEGRFVPIPPGVGITPDCTHALHTHNYSGVIHVEHPQRDDFTLGDFFLVARRWGGFDPLEGRQVVRVSVDGERQEIDYRTLPLADGLGIHIELVRLISA